MKKTLPSVADRRRTFRELHASGCFVIPNPWDPGTARYLQSLGFKAPGDDELGLRVDARAAGQRHHARDGARASR
jgi:hypothetical protein